MMVGSVLGVLFVSLVRRVLVEDPELPFPESVAASEIHKAGQAGAQAAKYLFYNMAFGARGLSGRRSSTSSPPTGLLLPRRATRQERPAAWAARHDERAGHGRHLHVRRAPPSARPIIGVGYVIGPELAALNFSGSVLAWGLLIPLLMYFLGPQLQAFLPANADRR